MNLVAGEISDGVFRAEGVTVPGLAAADGPVTLGFRAEDAALTEAGQGGEIQAPIYAAEHHGDAAMLTMRIADAAVSVKAPKDVRAKIGEPASFRVPAAICHLFDHATGTRLAC
jgi:multiple sugar transport system ATP-binding protein